MPKKTATTVQFLFGKYDTKVESGSIVEKQTATRYERQNKNQRNKKNRRQLIIKTSRFIFDVEEVFPFFGLKKKRHRKLHPMSLNDDHISFFWLFMVCFLFVSIHWPYLRIRQISFCGFAVAA